MKGVFRSQKKREPVPRQLSVQVPLTCLSISAGGPGIRPWILNDSGLSARRLSLSIQAPSPRRAQSTLGI